MAKKGARHRVETQKTKPDLSETAQPAPIKLEFIESDNLAVCDPATGICTVPNVASPASRGRAEQPEPTADQGSFDRKESSGS